MRQRVERLRQRLSVLRPGISVNEQIISPDGKTLALLTYGKVLLFDIAQGMNLQHPTQCLKIARAQTEAIVFVNNTDFVISNERKGELWKVTKKKNLKGPQ